MKSTPAAIYCRISQDRAGDELGVDRQRQDCEALAAQHGWQVAEVFVDDDRSAYSGKPRPGYERLLEALKSGTVRAVVAWHPDRLHRSPLELEGFIDVVNASGAAVATVQAGELDLATAAGRMTARVVGAVARHESEQKSERIRRQREQMAMQGRSHGGRRPFGYQRGGVEVDPTEAELVREAVRRFLAGESLRSIALDWNRRGISSASGGQWKTTSLRTMLAGPRLAGLRVHRGEVVGEALWEPIVTRGDHDRIVALLGNPRHRRRGRPPTSLLFGLLICGHCEELLTHSRRLDGSSRYICNRQPGSPACGRMGIVAEPIEEAVVEAVFRRLDRRPLDRVLARQKRAPTSDSTEIPGIESRLSELAELFAAGDITRAEWLTARNGLERRLARARADQVDAIDRARLAPWAGKAGALRTAWPELDRDRQRSTLQAAIARLIVAPGVAGSGRRPEDRLSYEWLI